MELDGAKIILLESEPEILDILRNGLQSEGATVLESTDPNYVEKVIPDFDAHIVVCDQRTSEDTGPLVLRKAAERNPRPACILLSGFANEEEINQKDFIVITKPFKTPDFLKRILHEFRNVRLQWKRLQRRIPCMLNAVWRKAEGPFPVKIVDISLKGAFIQIDQGWPRPLDIVTLALSERDFMGLKITGQVRWVRRQSRNNSRPKGFGILFDASSSKVIEGINRRII